MLAKSWLNRGIGLRSCSLAEVRLVDWLSLSNGAEPLSGTGNQFQMPMMGMLRGFHTSLELDAARKGTRARKEKAKAKAKVKKEDFKKPFLLRRLHKESEMEYKNQRPFDKSHYPQAVDDVYFYRKYQYTRWNFTEAVQNHREVHDPMVYNVPNSPLTLRIDMDFRYPNRPQKCQDKWKTVIEMAHPFLLPGMVAPTVLVVCPPNQNDMIQATIEAGADVSGSTEIIKAIQAGEIHGGDYEYIVCHPLVIAEMTVIRGLCKKNFPSTRTKTIDADLPAAVKRLKGGLKVAANCSDREPDYGYIEVPIGTLSMETAELESNFEAIFRDTVARRVPGKAPEDFILQCVLKTPHSFEEFKLHLDDYILKYGAMRRGGRGKQVEAEAEEPAEDEEPDQEKQAATA